MVPVFESLLGKTYTHTLDFEIFKSFVQRIVLFALQSAFGLLGVLRAELRAYTWLVPGSEYTWIRVHRGRAEVFPPPSTLRHLERQIETEGKRELLRRIYLYDMKMLVKQNIDV